MTDNAEKHQISALGPSLRTIRERRGISLQEAAFAVCIRESFLQAIEAGRYDKLPGTAYAAGFIRAYADYLDLDGDKAVHRYRIEAAAPAVPTELQFPTPIDESNTPQAGIILVGLLLSVVAYGGWYASTMNDEVAMDLVSPVPGRLASLLPGGNDSGAAIAPATDGTGGGADGGMGSRPPVLLAETAPSGHAGGENRAGSASGTHAESQLAMAADAPVADLRAALPALTGAGSQTATGAAKSAEPGTGIGFDAPAEVQIVHVPRMGADAHAAVPLHAIDGSPLAGESDALDAIDSASDAETEGRIVLAANATTWVQVKNSQGKPLISKLMEPGDTYTVPDQQNLRMTVGNAGGLDVEVDGRGIPALGKSGEVLRVVLDAEQLRQRDAVRH